MITCTGYGNLYLYCIGDSPPNISTVQTWVPRLSELCLLTVFLLLYTASLTQTDWQQHIIAV